jgi:hypothetical protein
MADYYDVEMFEKRAPDFIGSILVKDSEGDIHVASQEQFNQVRKLFDQYYNYIIPKIEKKGSAHARSFKNMSLRDFE